jgi:hypothetical protein
MEFFDLKSIQKIVDFNYSLVKEYVIKKLFIPFGFFMLVFLIFMHFVFPYKDEDSMRIWYIILLLLNLLFATYFLINEVRQFINEGISYLGSLWNYIDIIPPIGIYIISVMLFLS